MFYNLTDSELFINTNPLLNSNIHKKSFFHLKKLSRNTSNSNICLKVVVKALSYLLFTKRFCKRFQDIDIIV